MKNTGRPSRLTPEEKRLALIKTQRETTRVVKRTLIGVAIFMGLYYLYLIKTQTDDVDVPRTIPVSAVSTLDQVDASGSTDGSSSSDVQSQTK